MATSTYKVKSGDTIRDISQRHAQANTQQQVGEPNSGARTRSIIGASRPNDPPVMRNAVVNTDPRSPNYSGMPSQRQTLPYNPSNPAQMQLFSGANNAQNQSQQNPYIYGNPTDISIAQGLGMQGQYVDTSKVNPNQINYQPGGIALGGAQAQGGLGAGMASQNDLTRLAGDNRAGTEQAIQQYMQQQGLSGQPQQYTPTTSDTQRNIYGNATDIALAQQSGLTGNYIDTSRIDPSQLQINPGSLILGGGQALGGVSDQMLQGVEGVTRLSGPDRQATEAAIQNYLQQLGPQSTHDASLDNIIRDLMEQINTRQDFDPYSSPEYMAAQAQSDRQTQDAVRQAQESLGSAGFGRSTTLGERAQGIAGNQQEYMMTQILPQVIAQEEARRQQDINNQFGMAGQLTQQQQQQIQNRMAESGLTGQYMGDQTQQAQQQEFQQGIQEGQLTGDYQGQRTLPGQQFDWQQQTDQRNFQYGQQRDNVADQQWQQQHDQRVEQFEQDLGFRYDQLEQQDQHFIDNMAQREAEHDRLVESGDFDQAIRVWETTGQIPDTLTGFFDNAGIDVDKLNQSEIGEEVLGLFDTLSKESDANLGSALERELERINLSETQGIIDPDTAEALRDTIYMFDPTLDPNAPVSPGFLESVRPYFGTFGRIGQAAMYPANKLIDAIRSAFGDSNFPQE